jgi:hypothetical protein
MAITPNRQRAAIVMFASALLTLTIAAVIYAGIVPIGDARVRSVMALAIVVIAVIDAGVGVYHLTRS